MSVTFLKMKFQQNAVIYNSYTKIQNFNKIRYKYLVNTLLMLKYTYCYSFPGNFKQK